MNRTGKELDPPGRPSLEAASHRALGSTSAADAFTAAQSVHVEFAHFLNVTWTGWMNGWMDAGHDWLFFLRYNTELSQFTAKTLNQKSYFIR